MKAFKNQGITLPVIRAFDSPGKDLPFDSRLISLRQPDRDYGKDYLPANGEISLILDKCYYLPTENSPEEKTIQQ